jgi:two-component system OmpR family sensor kinase
LLILLPIVWIVSSLVAAFATNVVLSPLLKAKNISHELKNPLARVASSLQLIHDEAPASLKKLIKESANELIQLGGNVDSILSLSLLRKNNGDQDKYTNVKRELDKFKTTIPNNLKLTVKVSKNLIIPLDMNLANIIFRNLIDNAVKYNDKDGYININALKKGKNWTFTIKNSVSKKPTKTGYGLGMTIVKDICHNHDIEFNSFSTENYFLIELRGNLSKQNAANGSIPLHSRQHFFRY